jgi:hypothetical protein
MDHLHAIGRQMGKRLLIQSEDVALEMDARLAAYPGVKVNARAVDMLSFEVTNDIKQRLQSEPSLPFDTKFNETAYILHMYSLSQDPVLDTQLRMDIHQDMYRCLESVRLLAAVFAYARFDARFDSCSIWED